MLDFYAVTDHAYFLGMWWAVKTDPAHPLRSNPEAVRIRGVAEARYERGVAYRVAFRWPKEQYRARGHALDVARHPGRGPAALRPGELHDVHRVRVHAGAEHGRAAPERHLPGREGAPEGHRPQRHAEPGVPVGLDGPLPRRRDRSTRDSTQHEPLERPDVRRHLFRRLAARRGLRRATHAQRAAGRDHPDQGHLGHPSRPVRERRVGELRDRALQARRRLQQEPAARQLRPGGAAERPALPGADRGESLPVRFHRLERHPQRRRALRGVEVRRQGGGLHERPGRPRVRSRAARRSWSAVPRTGRGPVAGRARVPHAGAAARPPGDRTPVLRRIRPCGHLGAGEHPGGPVRRDAAQGDLRDQRSAHHRAVRGRGDPRGRAERRLPRHARRRRGAGRGSRVARRRSRRGSTPGRWRTR